MAAASDNLFIKVRQNFSTTIGAGGVAAADTTTIPLTSVSNLPDDTAIELVINRVDSAGTDTNNYETVRGIISGSNLVNVVRGVEGTAQAWAAGIVVEYLITADIQNRMVTGLLVEHGQDGVHSTATFLKNAGAQTITGVKTFAQSAIFQSGYNVSGTVNDSSTSAVSGVHTYSQSAIFQSGFVVQSAVINSAIINEYVGGTAIASGANVTTGTDNTKIVTPKAIGDAGVNTRLASKISYFGRDLSAVSGDVAITGVGFTPTSLIVTYQMDSLLKGSGTGISDVSRTVRTTFIDFNNQYFSGDYFAYASVSAGVNQTCIVKSYDADGFTLTWTKNGSPTGTVVLNVICFR